MKTNTNQKTFNKAVKAEVKRLFKNARKFVKSWVPGIGQTFYIKDADGENIAFVYKENGVMVIHEKI